MKKMVFFTVSDENNNLTNLNVHEDTSMTIIMNVIENDFNISMKQHDLYFEGKIIQETDTLKKLNVKDGDLLFVRKKLAMDSIDDFSALRNPTQGVNGIANDNRQIDKNVLNEFKNILGSIMSNMSNAPNTQNASSLSAMADLWQKEQTNIAIERQTKEMLNMKNDKYSMEALERINKELHDAIMASNEDEIKRIIKKETEENMKKRIEDQKKYENAMKNPLSEESQRYIADQIAHRQIQNNLEMATEHFPESFADVYMLYVRVEINKICLNAFIDSGAQRSIMSKSCAEKCNILRLLDTRYKGIAKGVGTQDLLGRIHVVDIKIGNKFFAVSLSIIDNDDIGFIFGLDMLRRHQCSIDLRQNALVIGTEIIPFLPEKDIPENVMRNFR